MESIGRLLTQLGRDGRVQVVERSLLGQVIDEQKLSRSGMVDEAQAQKIGRVMGVEAVVSGSILRGENGKAEINARLIHSENARVLGAAVAEVPRDWAGSSRDLADAPRPAPDNVMVVPPPVLDMAAVDFKPWWEAQSSGSGFTPSDCGGWEEEVDRLQRSTLEIKADFWAHRLLGSGLSRKALTQNPGSKIRNLQTRSEFYRRLKELYDSGAVAVPPQENLHRLADAERRAAGIKRGCE